MEKKQILKQKYISIKNNLINFVNKNSKILWCIVIYIICFCLISVFFYNKKFQLYQMYNKKASELANESSEYIYSPNYSPEFLDLINKPIYKNIKGLKHIIITNIKNKVLAHNNHNYLDSELNPEHIENKDILDFPEEIKMDGEVVGIVHIVILKSYIDDYFMAETIFLLIIILSGVTIFIFWFGYILFIIQEYINIFFMRHVYLPLEKINNGGLAYILFGKYIINDDFKNAKDIILKIQKDQISNNLPRINKYLITKISQDVKSEIEALTSLEHPNIVNFYDFNPFFRWIAIEYVHGKNLSEINFQTSIDIAVYIIMEICKALKHAHNKKLIHNDIKPENVLISYLGHVKLTDFNISNFKRADYFDNIIGVSIDYASPERILNFRNSIKIDERSDIYSLGIVLYEMLSKKKLHNFKSLKQARLDIPTEYIEPIINIRSDICSDLNDIVMKCIEIDKHKRYQNIIELEKDLQSLIDKNVLNQCVKKNMKQFMETKFQNRNMPYHNNYPSEEVISILNNLLSFFPYIIFKKLAKKAKKRITI